MTDHDAFAERERGLEEEYFHRKEKELVDMMRRASAAEKARRDMMAQTGIHEPDMLRELEALGFTPDTVSLLPILPVVEMAWASGQVTDAERGLVIEFARSRGIQDGSVADRELAGWLAERPSADVFARGRRVVRAMLTAGGHTPGALTADELVDHCEAVASASGGIFGLHKISADERALLTRMASDFKKKES